MLSSFYGDTDSHVAPLLAMTTEEASTGIRIAATSVRTGRNDSVGEGLCPSPTENQYISIHLLHYCVTRRTAPKYHAPRPSFTAPATPSRSW